MATTEYYAPSHTTHLQRRPSIDSTIAPSIASTFRIAPSTLTLTSTRTQDPDNTSLYAPSTAASRTILGDEPSSTAPRGPGSFLRTILKSKLRRGNPSRLFEAPGDRGLSLLHRAVQRGDIQSVRELIAGGADPNARRARPVNGYQETALYLAVKAGWVDIVEVLLEAGADVDAWSSDDYNRWTPLQWAAQMGCRVPPGLVGRDGVKVREVEEDEGLRARGLEVGEMLLGRGARVEGRDFHERTALWLACQKANAPFTSLLLRHNANPSHTAAYGLSCLAAAIEGGSIPCLSYLLDAGADITAESKEWNNNTVLHQAIMARENAIGMLDLLLKRGRAGEEGRGIEVDVRDRQGWTALHLAASRGDVEAAHLLLHSGADSTLKTDPPSFLDNAEVKPRWSVLGLAKKARKRSEETVEMIKRYSAKRGDGNVGNVAVGVSAGEEG